MAIDWSKAPCNATHGREHLGGVDFYRRDEAGTWNFWYVNRWEYAIGTSESSCVARPKSWNGEGLPPVGVPVEYRSRLVPNDKWHPTMINYLTGQHVIYIDCNGYEARDNPADIEFRTIRTPEQFAAEKRAAAIKDMAYLMTGHGDRSKDSFTTLCGILYDQGYRKQEPKPE